MPVDPYGVDPVADSYFMGDDPWYAFSIDNLIRQGAQTAQVALGGYPPNTNVVYSPTYYPLPVPPDQSRVPLPGGHGPVPPPVTPAPEAPRPGGIQLSTNTLMLLVGGFLLFTLGKRGR